MRLRLGLGLGLGLRLGLGLGLRLGLRLAAVEQALSRGGNPLCEGLQPNVRRAAACEGLQP